MQEKKVDFLLIQNSQDYLGWYVKWFTDVPATHHYPAAVIFPASDEMTTIWHGSTDPALAGPTSSYELSAKSYLPDTITITTFVTFF